MTSGSIPATELHRSPWVRGVYFAVGLLALLAGIAGAVLPVLPTTPFVLLAAACFARSSDRFYNALLTHRIAGPIIADWRQHRAMRRETKRWAYGLMAVSFGTSIWVMPDTWHREMLLVMAVVLAYFIWRVPVRAPNPEDDSRSRLSN